MTTRKVSENKEKHHSDAQGHLVPHCVCSSDAQGDLAPHCVCSSDAQGILAPHCRYPSDAQIENVAHCVSEWTANRKYGSVANPSDAQKFAKLLSYLISFKISK